MGVEDELARTVDDVLHMPWDIRQGRIIPSTEDVKLKGGGVQLDVTVLYADLRQSSKLATEFYKQTAAKVFRCFLACATKIITEHGGKITSFDGDRVMGVFEGNTKNTSAVISALKINYAVQGIIDPQIRGYFKSLRP